LVISSNFFKVEKFPFRFKQLFIIEEFTLVGIDVYDDIYHSQDYISGMTLTTEIFTLQIYVC